MSTDPVSRAVSAATVSLPYAEFQALVAGKRTAEASQPCVEISAREAGIQAVFNAFAEVLGVKRYSIYGRNDPNESEPEALCAEARIILRSASFTDDASEVLAGPAMHAMRERLVKLEALATAVGTAENMLRHYRCALPKHDIDPLLAALANLRADEVVF